MRGGKPAAQVRVILVEPKEAGNVGAVARAMKNFGLHELWIAGRHPELFAVSGWWASGADDVLASARVVETLGEALAGTHLTVATTSMRGRTSPVTFTPRSLGERAATLQPGQVLALVFGREDSGLTREELVLCQYTAAIPANDAFPTMNLAQAACVFAYELSAPEPLEQPARDLPDAAMIERIHQRAQALLQEVGFLHETNPSLYDDLRAIVARASLDQREATITLGILRQIEWKLRQREPGAEE